MDSYKPPEGFYLRGRMLWYSYKHPVGGWRSEPTGCPVGEEREAGRRRKAFLERLKAGNVFADPRTGKTTVRSFGEVWLQDRIDRKMPSARTYGLWLRRYIFPAFGDRPMESLNTLEVRDWLKRLKKMPAHTGGKQSRKREGRAIAPRTVRHVFNALKLLYRCAIAEQVLGKGEDPCILLPGELPAKKDRDPGWRKTAVFSKREVELLIADPRIPQDRQVWYALNFLGGMRTSEVAALLWSDYEPDVEPLGRLACTKAWSRELKEMKTTKTDCPRDIPVHPGLAAALARWRLSGWRALRWHRDGQRDPQPGDLIIPTRYGGPRGQCSLTQIHADLEMLGLRKRRMYDSRRTFQSLAMADGAPKDHLKWVTHGVAEDIQDEYTTLPWETRCAAVAKLRIGRPEAQVLALPKAANSGAPGGSFTTASLQPEEGSGNPVVAARVASGKSLGPAGLEGATGLGEQRRSMPVDAGQDAISGGPDLDAGAVDAGRVGSDCRGCSEHLAAIREAMRLIDEAEIDAARERLCMHLRQFGADTSRRRASRKGGDRG